MPKTRRLSDAALVRRSQQGDRRAFSALLGRYDWRLRGLAHALLLDQGEMDAALATAYLRAWRDVVRIGSRDDIAAWLYRVAYNACIDQLRRSDGQAAPVSGPATSLTKGLASLPAAHRVAVVLVDREGFSAASAARIMGLPHGDLVASLEQARDHLMPYLSEAVAVGSRADEPEGGEPTGVDAEPNGAVGTNGADGESPAAADESVAEAEAEAEAEAGQEAKAEQDAEAEQQAEAEPAAAAETAGERAPAAVGALRHAVSRQGDQDATGSDIGEAGAGNGAFAAGGEPAVAGDDVGRGNGAAAADEGGSAGSNGKAGADVGAGNGAAAADEGGSAGSNGKAGDGRTVAGDDRADGRTRINGGAGTPADAEAEPVSAGGTGGGVEGNGQRPNRADPNRGKGRRARKRAKHAAQRARAEGSDGRDGTTG